jgi:hypothetical protein
MASSELSVIAVQSACALQHCSHAPGGTNQTLHQECSPAEAVEFPAIAACKGEAEFLHQGSLLLQRQEL